MNVCNGTNDNEKASSGRVFNNSMISSSEAQRISHVGLNRWKLDLWLEKDHRYIPHMTSDVKSSLAESIRSSPQL